MNILIDIRLLASGKISGIEEYTRNIVGSMLNKDSQNTYTLFYNSLRRRDAAFPEPQDRYALKRYFIPNKLFDASVRFLRYPKIDKWMSADIIFSPHFNILAYQKKTKRVITIHDLSFVHHAEFFSARKRFWHWLQGYKRQIQSADHIIAVSEYTKGDIINIFQIPEEKITRIYSGISCSFQQLVGEDSNLKMFRKKHNINYPFFLHFAALEPRKNVIAAIQAFNIMKRRRSRNDFRLVLAGGSGWLYDDILAEIRKSPASEDIVLFGEVLDDERVYLYNLAYAFIYPSFFEGFGFPPLEAQACGIPVIASNRSSLPEILADSALLIDPWRVEDIVGAMEELIDDEKLKNNLIARGSKNIMRFNWDTAAKETLQVFQRCA